MSFKPVLAFHNQTIDKLVTQVAQQKDLLSVVQSVLPPNLAEHTLHCVIHDATLLLYTDAAVWSSQLRFHSSAILAAITPLFSQRPVKRVEIRLSRS